MKIDHSKPFSKPDYLDTLGWNINFSELEVPKPDYISLGRLFESPNKKYSLCFYAVDEYRMMSFGGPIAIFENKESPSLLCNPKNTWFTFQGDYTLIPDNRFFFIVLLAYHTNEKLSGYPFVAIDLENKRFGFIEFNYTSYYYTLVRLTDSVFKLTCTAPKEIEYRKLQNRENELIDLSKITYYDFNEFNDVPKLYFSLKAEGKLT